MLTQDRRVLLHEDYLVTFLSNSERTLNQYQDVQALVCRGLNTDIGPYGGAPRSITGATVPAGFAFMPFFILRNYASVANDWRANPVEAERTIL